MATQGLQLSCKDENLISQHHCFKRQMWWTMLIIPVLGGWRQINLYSSLARLAQPLSKLQVNERPYLSQKKRLLGIVANACGSSTVEVDAGGSGV